MLIWLLSPFKIIISGMWGMFPPIVIAFVLISIMTTGPLRRGVWAGMGIFAKSIPIIYAIPATIKQARGSLGMLLAIGLPALFSVATFLVMRWPLPTIEATLLSAAGTGGDSMSGWDSFFYFNYLGLLPPLEPNVARILGLLWIPALIALTVVAFRRFRFDTDYGLVQSLIVTTLAFLIFKARVTEQYGIYLFALFAIDVSLWNPKRKRLMLVTMAVVLVYLVTNNYFLIRFLSPVYPNFTEVELRMYQEIGGIRYAAKFLLGTLFTYLNIRYLVATINRKA